MDELLEAFTREGDPAGAPKPAGVKTRAEIHRDGDWHIATFTWVIDTSSGEILLQRRALHKDVWPGRWDASAAGHLEAGEAIERGMQRELEEELGLAPSFTAGRLERLTPFHFEEHVHDNGRVIDREIHAVHLLRVTPNERALLLHPGEEVLGLGWVAANDLLRHATERGPLRVRTPNEKDLLLEEGDLVPYATAYLTMIARHALA